MKLINKKLVTAVLFSLGFSVGGICVNPAYAAETATTNIQVNVQIEQAQGVNWEKGADSDVTAIGIGFAPQNSQPGMGNALARRAAVTDARRNLLEFIKGVQIDSETSIQDLVITNDVVTTRVNGIIQGARIVSEGVNADGSYYVKMSVPLYGAQSVAAAAIPEVAKNIVSAPVPQVTATALPKNEVKQLQTSAYTGVIVDASGLGLQPTFSPTICDTNGRVVYGMANINPDLAISKGMVEYTTNLQEAAGGASRAGANPLVIRAERVSGGKNSVHPVNVVVTVDDADKILLANDRSAMLENCAVVFVK